jgi:nitrate reductase NapE component
VLEGNCAVGCKSGTDWFVWTVTVLCVVRLQPICCDGLLQAFGFCVWNRLVVLTVTVPWHVVLEGICCVGR